MPSQNAYPLEHRVEELEERLDRAEEYLHPEEVAPIVNVIEVNEHGEAKEKSGGGGSVIHGEEPTLSIVSAGKKQGNFSWAAWNSINVDVWKADLPLEEASLVTMTGLVLCKVVGSASSKLTFQLFDSGSPILAYNTGGGETGEHYIRFRLAFTGSNAFELLQFGSNSSEGVEGISNIKAASIALEKPAKWAGSHSLHLILSAGTHKLTLNVKNTSTESGAVPENTFGWEVTPVSLGISHI